MQSAWGFLNIIFWNNHTKGLFGWYKPKFDFSELICDSRYIPTLALNNTSWLMHKQNKACASTWESGEYSRFKTVWPSPHPSSPLKNPGCTLHIIKWRISKVGEVKLKNLVSHELTRVKWTLKRIRSLCFKCQLFIRVTYMANSCEFRDPSTHLLLKVLRLLRKQDHAHTKVASFHRRKGFVCDFMSPALAFAVRKA